MYDEDRTGVYAIDPRDDRLVSSHALKMERVAAIRADIRDDERNNRTRDTILAHKKWRDCLLLRRLCWKNGTFKGLIANEIATQLHTHGIASDAWFSSSRKILLRKNGEVVERFENGTLGNILVPASKS